MDALSEATRWVHMLITAGGFAVTLDHLGATVGQLFAAVAAMCGVCSALLYASHMYEKYREED